MGLITPTLPTPGQPRGGEELDVTNALQALVTLVNGNLDAANLVAGAVGASELADGAVDASSIEPALAQIIGVGAANRGKAVIPAAETYSDTVNFGTMTTPDQVTGIIVPTDGILWVQYIALAKVTGATAPSVGVAIDGSRTLMRAAGTAPSSDIGSVPTGGFYTWLYTWLGNGQRIASDALGGADSASGAAFAGGDWVPYEVAAGTHSVAIQFKAGASSSVTVKERKLRVKVEAF